MAGERKFEISDARAGAAVNVRVVTQAAQTEFAGLNDGWIKVRLIAEEAGSYNANEELQNFLADKLGVQPDQVEIVAGMTGRDKIVSIEGVTTAQVEAVVRAAE